MEKNQAESFSENSKKTLRDMFLPKKWKIFPIPNMSIFHYFEIHLFHSKKKSFSIFWTLFKFKRKISYQNMHTSLYILGIFFIRDEKVTLCEMRLKIKNFEKLAKLEFWNFLLWVFWCLDLVQSDLVWANVILYMFKLTSRGLNLISCKLSSESLKWNSSLLDICW